MDQHGLHIEGKKRGKKRSLVTYEYYGPGT